MSDGTGIALRYEKEFEVESLDDLSRLDEPKWKASGFQKYPAWLFVADGLRLHTAHPVQVVIERIGDKHFASCQRLHVFAEGSSASEAMDDLSGQVVYFYKRYSKLGDDEVTGLAAELREIYQNRFSVQSVG
jgi:hypothetical protein